MLVDGHPPPADGQVETLEKGRRVSLERAFIETLDESGWHLTGNQQGETVQTGIIETRR
jgi:hypothetical protein